ncbi:MAG: alpha/beta hydrolase [Robiginitomaculum sp.]|nr:MAG: alpha/beta hydrolase [Robiginitomaculum sp.]
MKISEQKLTFAARDGAPLGGVLIAPKSPIAGLLISSATAVTTDFYAHFAKYAAQRGFACLLYDCRGVGSSRPEHLRGYQATMADWGQLDASGALDELERQVPNLPLFTLGHSVGGHFIGFMDNHAKATAHAFIAVGSGYWGGHWAKDWVMEFIFFWILGPWNLFRHGYLQHGGRWQGTDLPAGVYSQWRSWCLNPKYLWPDVSSGRLGRHWFGEVKEPIRSYGFTDDPVVNPKTLPVVLDWYSRAPKETIWVEPASIGSDRIGHMGAFSRKNAKFWELPLDWFESLI